MKHLFTFLLAMAFLNVYAANYYTRADGNFNSAANWSGNNRPNGGCYPYNTGDTYFIRNVMTSGCSQYRSAGSTNIIVEPTGSLAFSDKLVLNGSSNLTIQSGADVTVEGDFIASGGTIVVQNGGKLTVKGDTDFNSGTQLTIEEGGEVVFEKDFNSSNNASVMSIAGKLDIVGDVTQIASEWDITSTGWLNVGGNFTNDNGNMDFNSDGATTIGGDVSFHSGSFVIGEEGYFTGGGTSILIGNATITNEGYMGFPDVTDLGLWGTPTNWDCDGSSGTGSVDFGQNVNCGSACGNGSGKCTSSSPSIRPNPLPIELAYFNAELYGGQFNFEWETLSEENNEYFTIEYTTDLKSFTEVLTEDGAGNSYSSIQYNASAPVSYFEDYIYFRLKQTDFDGESSYSKLVAVSISSAINDGLKLYPNPTEGRTLLQLAETNDEPVSAQIVSTISMNVVDTFLIENGQAVLDLSNLENGVYFISVPELSSAPFRVVVQK